MELRQTKKGNILVLSPNDIISVGFDEKILSILARRQFGNNIKFKAVLIPLNGGVP